MAIPISLLQNKIVCIFPIRQKVKYIRHADNTWFTSEIRFRSEFYTKNPTSDNLKVIGNYRKHYRHKINDSEMNVNKTCWQIINKNGKSRCTYKT